MMMFHSYVSLPEGNLDICSGWWFGTFLFFHMAMGQVIRYPKIMDG